MRDKILFLLERYEYNDNVILLAKNLVFLSNVIASSYTILKRSLNSILENKIDLAIKTTEIAYKTISKIILETISEIISETISETINIAKVETISYYRLVRDKENKLFSLII